MNELRDLYQEAILDHNRSPRNFRRLACPSCSAEGFNPLCGDRIHLEVELDGEVIRDIGFQGSGCAISKASASMMSSMVKGKTRSEAEKMFADFHDMVTKEDASPSPILGKLSVFSGVREFPARVKCAILAWHALQSALQGKSETVKTE